MIVTSENEIQEIIKSTWIDSADTAWKELIKQCDDLLTHGIVAVDVEVIRQWAEIMRLEITVL
jgi:hypothetical protein